jgi:hypothetical protein
MITYRHTGLHTRLHTQEASTTSVDAEPEELVTPAITPVITPVIAPAVMRAATAFSQPEAHANDVVIQVHLQSLRSAQRLDCAFVVLFDREQQSIEQLIAPRYDWVVNDPQKLLEVQLPANSILKEHLGAQHVLEIDYITEYHGELRWLTDCVEHFNMKSLLVGGIIIHNTVAGFFVMGGSATRRPWEMDIHATMRLMIASYATGRERHLENLSYYRVKVW